MLSLRAFLSISALGVVGWMIGCGVSAEEAGPNAAGSDGGATTSSTVTPPGPGPDGAVIDGPIGTTVGPDGTVPSCTPSCATKACGEPDGCGGACTTCSKGPGCNVATGTCAPCTKACGANGTCVPSWEGGDHCRCAPGFYETLAGCAPVSGSPCDGIDCGPNGSCFAGPPLNAPECRCTGNTVNYGRKCAAMDKIRCIGRDGKLADKGTIRCSSDDLSWEVCRDGDGNGTVEWVASGTASCEAGSTCSACMNKKCDAGDGTGGQPCPTGTVCMSKVHETDVYLCMPSCNCENCGTCDPDDFTTWQRSCGSNTNDLSSATIACSSPCPHASDGCLPYGQFAYCFPNEGCASGAPQ